VHFFAFHGEYQKIDSKISHDIHASLRHRGGIMDTSKTSTGLEENVTAVLCYLDWWITGIIFFLLEENKVVRFHVM
jgi:hypothetical protein